MKRAEKLIEIESLLENLMKSRRDGSILRMKILFFGQIYENLSVSMIIEKLGIKKEEVIAIGDNVNDQTMLENAGLGVAMANSAPYIQQMGKIVTDSNNEDGVAKVIEKYILSE